MKKKSSLILEKRIIPVTRPTDNQKAVLAKIVAAATPKIAAADISETPNLAAARDMLEKMGLIKLDDEGAMLTKAGEDVMVDQNLMTSDGQLTVDGRIAAYGEEAASRAAGGPSPDMNMDMGDALDFGDDSNDELDLDLDLNFNESFALLKAVRKQDIMENLMSAVPEDLYYKLTTREKMALHDVLSGHGNLHDHEKLYKKLFDYFRSQMPYGTAKARTGDPEEFILRKLSN